MPLHNPAHNQQKKNSYIDFYDILHVDRMNDEDS